MSSWVTTATGHVFDFDRLLSGQAQIFAMSMHDFSIPHSRSPRWMGIVDATRAEHLVMTSMRGEDLAESYGVDRRDAAVCCLMHDAMEVLVADLPRPLKKRGGMREYNEIEEAGMTYLSRSFGFGEAWANEHMQMLVDQADAEMLAVEIRDLVPSLPAGYSYDLAWSAPSTYKIKTPAGQMGALRMFERAWRSLGISKVGIA